MSVNSFVLLINLCFFFFSIPSFAPELSDMFLGEVAIHGWRVMETFRVSEALHRRGINIRYLGLIRKHTMVMSPVFLFVCLFFLT